MEVCIAKEKMQDELKEEDKPEWCQLTSQSQHFYGHGRTAQLVERIALALWVRVVLFLKCYRFHLVLPSKKPLYEQGCRFQKSLAVS